MVLLKPSIGVPVCKCARYVQHVCIPSFDGPKGQIGWSCRALLIFYVSVGPEQKIKCNIMFGWFLTLICPGKYSKLLIPACGQYEDHRQDRIRRCIRQATGISSITMHQWGAIERHQSPFSDAERRNEKSKKNKIKNLIQIIVKRQEQWTEKRKKEKN